MARRRRRWIHYRDRIDPRRLVFIDETWIKTNMAPLRGWGDRGKRLIAHVPHGHWQTMTFIGALRHDRIEAPWVLNGPINAEAFKTYVRAELLKTLKPNDIVILDNLNSHKGKAVRAMVKAIGARLFFLPSYSPDLNPDEWVWKNMKNDQIAREVSQRPGHLFEIARRALRRLHAAPAKIRAFFADPHLDYIRRAYS